MKRFRPSRSISIALFLLLLAFFSSKFHTEGHRDLSDLQISKEMKEKYLGGEQVSLRKYPGGRPNPIVNNGGPSRKRQVTSREP